MPIKYETVVGKPYFWLGKDGQWRCRYRGYTLWVPHREVSRETLDALADKAQSAMLTGVLMAANRKEYRGR